MDRGTGRTTKQMKDAPKKAFYGVLREQMLYARHLSIDIDRKDLTILALHDKSVLYPFRGINRTIVVDHHALDVLPPKVLSAIEKHNDAVERRKRNCRSIRA